MKIELYDTTTQKVIHQYYNEEIPASPRKDEIIHLEGKEPHSRWLVMELNWYFSFGTIVLRIIVSRLESQ